MEDHRSLLAPWVGGFWGSSQYEETSGQNKEPLQGLSLLLLLNIFGIPNNELETVAREREEWLSLLDLLLL